MNPNATCKDDLVRLRALMAQLDDVLEEARRLRRLIDNDFDKLIERRQREGGNENTTH